MTKILEHLELPKRGLEFLKMYNHIEEMIKYEHKKNENNEKYMEADKERINQISGD